METCVLTKPTHIPEDQCMVCESKRMYRSNSIENASDILIVPLKYKGSNCHLSSVDKSPLQLDNSTHVLRNAILGFVQSLNCLSIVKINNVWHLLNDTRVCPIPWPKDNSKLFRLQTRTPIPPMHHMVPTQCNFPRTFTITRVVLH